MTNIILFDTYETNTTLLPSDFIRHNNEYSSFQKSYLHFLPLCEETVIVSTTCHYFTACDQIEMLEHNEPYYILEPFSRGSAAAMLLACYSLHPETIVLISSKHAENKYSQADTTALHEAHDLAESDMIIRLDVLSDDVTLSDIHGNENINTLSLPKKERSQESMFCFKIDPMLKAVEQELPEFYNKTKEAYKNAKHEEMSRISPEIMRKIPELQLSDMMNILAGNIDKESLPHFLF